jgi:probable DNA repair protein
MNTSLSLTPNRRLARFLREQEKQPGKILAWNDWLLEVWQTQYEAITGDHPEQCLSDWQSVLLWQEVITDLHTDPLLNKTQAITHARQAWSLAIQWQTDPLAWQGEKKETDTFLGWLGAYEAKCRSRHLLDKALLPQRLFNYWKAQPQAIPREVCLRGFDELTPLQAAILAYWESQGCSIQREAVSSETKPYTFLAFPERQSQLLQAALYAKEMLATRPDLPIGIIIPTIQDQWAQVHEIFTAVLGPDQPFNISAGQPLGQCPIIYAALQCLQGREIRSLLMTPYIRGGISEQSSRARFDARLMSHERDPLPLSFVRHHPEMPEQFKQCFESALNALEALEERQRLPSEWIEPIFQLLDRWGWPGDRTLSSEAYQAVTHFYGLITELASLDDFLGRISFARLRALFSQRAHQTMFQPESQHKPIQVLGILEAAGLSFSHLWVLDLGSDTWPAKPAPNPFIPMPVQVTLGIPHASFARELRFAQTMTERLLKSADTIILSYAVHGEEGDAMTLPTPLLSSSPIPAAHWGERPFTSLAQAIRANAQLNPLPDVQGLPLTDFHLKGGASVFKDQAACPFRAYAKHRLGAKSPEKSQMGLSGRQKGTLLHEVLERLWKKMKTRDAFLRLTPQEFQDCFVESIDRSLAAIQPPLSSIERTLEKQRLLPLLTQWFDHEFERTPFSIQALEQSHTATLEGLTLHLRVDRIDEMQGATCIIDYKTGEVDPKGWSEDRMDDPQLPLYASVIHPAPQALVFAQIRKDAMGWKGLGTLDLPGIRQVESQDWANQLLSWKNAFAQLAQEYKQGHAAVLPKRGSQTCLHCDLQAFCRINDAQ